MDAIETRYLGPTDTRGSRIVATCAGARLVGDYNHVLSGIACHREVAQQLAGKLGITANLIGGATKRGYVFVVNAGL